MKSFELLSASSYRVVMNALSTPETHSETRAVWEELEDGASVSGPLIVMPRRQNGSLRVLVDVDKYGVVRSA